METEGPRPLREYFKMTIEHGHLNHRSDKFYWTAWPAPTTSNRKLVPLPPVK